jgi:molecular chaperone DnaK
VVINNRDGDPTTPSVVLFASDSDYQVGKEAKRQIQLEPDTVCELVKRQMGNADWVFPAHGKNRSAPEVSALILKCLAEDAEMQTGEPVRDVVITVPAYFGDAQRQATRAAGEIAELNVVDVINEPTAAAFSYGFAQGGESEETVLVYDLGGGTFDVTIIHLTGDEIKVIVTDGDHMLGGVNWDQRMVEELARKFMASNPTASDPLDDDIGMVDLKTHAEDIKRALSGRDTVSEMVIAGADRANVQITREEFEELTRDLVEQTLALTRSAVREAQAEGYAEIDRVLLVGGSSFMPAIKRRLSEEFGWAPELEDPNQSVAKGAALAGQRAELRARIDERLQGVGKDVETAEEDEIRAAIESIAPEVGLEVDTAMTLATKRMANVCSRGFGVRLLKDGRAPSENQEDFYIHHLVKRNDRLPLDPPRTMEVVTVVANQHQLELELWEQGGSDLSELPGDNIFLTSGHIGLPGDDPLHSPMDLVFEMSGSGFVKVTLTHPRVAEPLTVTKDTGGAMSEEEIEQARVQVGALSRR